MATGFGLLRLSPVAFWAMTPREFEAATRVFAATSHAPPGRNDLAAMMRAFPDIKQEDDDG